MTASGVGGSGGVVMGSTPVTDRQSGSTTESAEINFLEAVPAIDRSPKLSEDDRVKKLQPLMPNLPIVYWQENKKKKVPKNNTSCTKFPDIYDLHFNNKYWQVLESSNGSFYLYGAYLDVRANNRLGPTVRVLGMINRLEPQVKTQCQLWFSDSPGTEPVVSKVLEYKYIWYKKWGNYKQGLFQPYLLACQLPKTHWGKTPVSVSIVENKCDKATNNLRVTYNKPEEGEGKKKFAVCVKGLSYPTEDISIRLIEWIELLHALGADTIYFYVLHVHENIKKALDYYEAENWIDVKNTTYPTYFPNMPLAEVPSYLKKHIHAKRQWELLPYNDCFYRNLYLYDYIALLDIDEVIMPSMNYSSWELMMEAAVNTSLRVRNITRASYNFKTVYFLDEMQPKSLANIPDYLHMMQHVVRSSDVIKPKNYYDKSFFNPEKVLLVHNHTPLACLGGGVSGVGPAPDVFCISHPVSGELGLVQHYRRDCAPSLAARCPGYKARTIVDYNIWRWRQPVMAGALRAINTLGLLENKNKSSNSFDFIHPK